MVRQVIFHIGFRKTGSSSIQKWLHDNRDDLLVSHSIYYPGEYMAFKYGHHKLTRPLLKKNFVGEYLRFHDELLNRKDNKENLKMISRKILSNTMNAETIIFSNESWTSYMVQKHRIKRFLRCLNAKDVKVICYVREHLDYTQSLWRERVHFGNRFNQSFSNFASKFLSEQNSMIHNILLTWSKLGDVHVKWFDRDRFHNGDVVEDFCRQVGILGVKHQFHDENPSIGGNLLLFKLARNIVKFHDVNALNRDQYLYENIKKIAFKTSRFRTPLYISDGSAEKFRQMSAYNQVLFSEIGRPRLRSWNLEPKIPDLDNLKDDLDYIFQELQESPDSEVRKKIYSLSRSYFELDPY